MCVFLLFYMHSDAISHSLSPRFFVVFVWLAVQLWAKKAKKRHSLFLASLAFVPSDYENSNGLVKYNCLLKQFVESPIEKGNNNGVGKKKRQGGGVH